MIIFRDADVEKMAADKFPILKTIRGITINNHSASISVGLCRGYNNIKESELNARKALEMALAEAAIRLLSLKKTIHTSSSAERLPQRKKQARCV